MAPLTKKVNENSTIILKLRFAPIIRVSKEKQKQKGESLNVQTEQIIGYVENLGGEIPEHCWNSFHFFLRCIFRRTSIPGINIWEFEKNKPNLQQVEEPAGDLSIIKEENSTVI